jgi:hypothetical protein
MTNTEYPKLPVTKTLFGPFKTNEADIINNKKNGVIYVADFINGGGKYISVTEDSKTALPDIDIKISARINLKITYILSSNKINGVEIAKVVGDKIEKISFSTMDFERILQLLALFSELDLKSIANKSIVLEKSLLGDATETSRFLNLIAADPEGKKKIAEVARNYGLIQVGDIDNIIHKKETVFLFERILNDIHEFEKYKKLHNIGKNEEVWQQYFSDNSWLLGTDFIEILDERKLDVGNITDYLLKSYDGFVDIIELKLPSAEFWNSELIPKNDLIKAIMQCNRYVLQTERNINNLEFNKKLNGTPIAKPRITLIYGRSNEWKEQHMEAYRVLNSSYTNLDIITYDHLLERAKRLLGINKSNEVIHETIRDSDLPF